MASRYDLEILIRTRKEGQGAKDAEQEVAGFGKRLEGTLDVVKKSAAAVAGAGVAFKKAFELSREGANLNQLTESFNLMNEQVFQSPSLLADMRAAVSGTIKDTDLMRGLLTLTAGASKEMAQEFAGAAPRLLEIAKASNKLNPTLGDTAFLYESIATGVKRGSPLILDNLGIVVKVGEANEKYAAQLGKTVDQLTAQDKQMALLNATLESGDRLIQQVGGSVDSQADSWARLEVQVGTALDNFKRFLADGLEPVIRAMAGDNAQVVEETIDRTLELTKTTEGLGDTLHGINESWRLSNSLLGSFTGTSDAVAQAAVKTARAFLEQGGTVEELSDALDKAGISEAAFRTMLERSDITVARSEAGLLSELRAIERRTERQEEAAAQQAELKRAQDELSESTEELTFDFEASAARIEANNRRSEEALEIANERREAMEREIELSDDVEDSAIRVERALQEAGDAAAEEAKVLEDELAQAAIKAKEEHERLIEASGRYFNAVLEGRDEIGLYGVAIDDLGESYVRVGGLNKEQRDDLDRLQNAYSKAERELRDYEIGLKGGGLSAEELAEKMSEQREEMERLSGAMAPLLDQTGELQTVNNEAVFDIDAVNEAVFRQAQEAGLSAEQLGLLGVATGQLTAEQAEAAVKAALLLIEIDKLIVAYKKGDLSAQEVTEAARLLGDQTVTTAEQAQGLIKKLDEFHEGSPYKADATLDADDAISKARELKGLLDGLDGRTTHSRSEHTNETTNRTINETVTKEGQKGAKGQHGLNMIVPPGFPDDSFTIGVSSGERVLVTPAGASHGGLGGFDPRVDPRIPSEQDIIADAFRQGIIPDIGQTWQDFLAEITGELQESVRSTTQEFLGKVTGELKDSVRSVTEDVVEGANERPPLDSTLDDSFVFGPWTIPRSELPDEIVGGLRAAVGSGSGAGGALGGGSNFSDAAAGGSKAGVAFYFDFRDSLGLDEDAIEGAVQRAMDRTAWRADQFERIS